MAIHSQTKATNICKQNIHEFLSRNIGHWAGLKAGCKKGDVTAWFPFHPGEGIAYLGTQNVEYTFRSLPYAGFTEGVVFYFERDQLSFIATDFWSFDQQECAGLLERLGEPSQRLDFYWRHEKIENGEWVYLDRGITVGVIPATELVLRVIVYPPCTLNIYKEKYYNNKLAREFRRH